MKLKTLILECKLNIIKIKDLMVWVIKEINEMEYKKN